MGILGMRSTQVFHTVGGETSMPLPDIKLFLVTTPLYEPIKLAGGDEQRVHDLLGNHVTYDCYCPQCEQDSTFSTYVKGEKVSEYRSENMNRLTMLRLNGGNGALSDWNFALTAFCGRSDAHVMKFYFAIRNRELTKVGQYPSLADVSSSELTKYRKVLGKERSSELYKAIGLAAHGVGVGSFVYLRRIFESLLKDHRKDADSRGVQIPNYDDMRTTERIDALKDSLPKFLVGNKAIYGILSAGIHDLTEDQCRKEFPILKDAIILILQQDAERQDREALEKRLTKEIGATAQALSASKKS